MIRGEPIDEQIVDERTVGHHEARVLGLADAQLGRVVACDALNCREGIAAGHFDLAHVADVEQAGPRAHRQVLLCNARVLDGHVPAGKRHHPGAERNVPSVQSSLLGY